MCCSVCCSFVSVCGDDLTCFTDVTKAEVGMWVVGWVGLVGVGVWEVGQFSEMP